MIKIILIVIFVAIILIIGNAICFSLFYLFSFPEPEEYEKPRKFGEIQPYHGGIKPDPKPGSKLLVKPPAATKPK